MHDGFGRRHVERLVRVLKWDKDPNFDTVIEFADS